jgi:hypothetical protein
VATIVDLYPHDGYGLIMLANTAGPRVTRQIADALADRFLGLPPAGQKVRVESPVDDRAEPHRQIPAAPALPLDTSPFAIADLTGTYASIGGYGNFTLCSPVPPTSPDCLAPVQAFRTVDAAAGTPTDPTDLYAVWPRFWASHIRFSRVSGNDSEYDYSYSAEITNLYVEGYGADRTPFEDVSDVIPARFAVEKGKVVGLGLSVALKPSWRAKKGGSLREIADVWFDRL